MISSCRLPLCEQGVRAFLNGHWHSYAGGRAAGLSVRRRQRQLARPAAWFSTRPTPPPAPESWELEADDWDKIDDYDEQEVINAIYEEDGSPDSLSQSILALTLTIVLTAVVGNILLKTVLVAWTLVGAAVALLWTNQFQYALLAKPASLNGLCR
ncbi:hypothetical protein WJX73_006317 [Symbiochloris irregularis]|uniref:Uncharacterized protein n=1 Tax=Symbiochloris irregularis TaxID=706552 RepID=A0AAW1NZT1_9CHLO